ncbi:sugar ABC transporter substrate-binding protein [Paenibacillus thiaminolyticus]|uniref:Sugar ABC transporter substrate-binding protein n=1 Tax=Paenibacillus thiaminolyticus TaxID=49283 RepID=A0A3A3GIC5_PANTH|nr:sugar ABC transporter substrate-binding protein [Paenibacillus thiaminolyticus]RJG21989.1 sugar ABC transporter substrate-binding protein [Paenibacillus thiaminolyticus]
MKKWSAALVLTLIVSLLASACSSGGGSSTQGADGGKAADVVELKFTTWGELNSDSVEAKLAEEFNNTHPNIKVTFEPVPGDGYATKLTTSLASGQAPDVFLIGEGDYFKYVDKGVVEPLDEYIQADSAFNTDIFQPDLLSMGNINGKLYYLPKDFNPLALWYNKRMFDEANIPYPTNDWTWDDMINTAKQLTQKDDKGKIKEFGFNATKWEYPIYIYLWLHGADIGNEDGTKAEGYMNSAKTIAAMESYIALSKGDDRVSPTPQDTETMGGDSSMFMTDKLAMMITGRWVKSDLDKSDVQYGSALIPTGPDGERASIIAAAGWAMNANGKHKKEAYELMKWLSGTEAQKARSEGGKVLPATVKELDEVKKTEVVDKPVIEMMDFAKKPISMRSANAPIFTEQFNKAVERILLGDATVKDALDQAAKEVDSKISK